MKSTISSLSDTVYRAYRKFYFYKHAKSQFFLKKYQILTPIFLMIAVLMLLFLSSLSKVFLIWIFLMLFWLSITSLLQIFLLKPPEEYEDEISAECYQYIIDNLTAKELNLFSEYMNHQYTKKIRIADLRQLKENITDFYRKQAKVVDAAEEAKRDKVKAAIEHAIEQKLINEEKNAVLPLTKNSQKSIIKTL